MEFLALLVLGGMIALRNQGDSSNVSPIDIVPPEFERKRSSDDLLLSPCDVARLPLQSLHNDYFNGYRPYSASLYYRPEKEAGNLSPEGFHIRESNPEGNPYTKTTIEIGASDLDRSESIEVEGHLFSEPTGMLRRGRRSVANALKAAAEVHLRWLPEQVDANSPTRNAPASDNTEGSFITLTEPPKNIFGHESRSFAQASFSSSGAGAIALKSAITLPDTKFSIFGSWPLFVGKSSGPKLKSADGAPIPTDDTMVEHSNAEVQAAHRAAFHDIEASRALHSRDQCAVPFAGASSHSMIDEKKLGARFDGDNILIGGFIERPSKENRLIDIFASSDEAEEKVPNPLAPPMLKAATPFFTKLFSAGPKRGETDMTQPTLGGWVGLRTANTVAIVDATLDFERAATDLNVSLRYRDQMRQKLAREHIRIESQGFSCHSSAANAPRDPRQMGWIEWLTTSNDDLNRMEREYVNYIEHKPLEVKDNPAQLRRTPSFELGIDIRKWGTEAIFSFRQRFIVRRKVRNIFEEKNVVGIHNPVDIGVQMGFGMHPAIDLSDASGLATSASNVNRDDLMSHFTSLSLVGQWQVNKNVLLKGRVQDTGIAGAIAFKAWSEPTATFIASGRIGYHGESPQFGLRFQSENFGSVEHHAASPTQITSHDNRFVSTPQHKLNDRKPM